MKRIRPHFPVPILRVFDEHDGRAHLLLTMKLPLEQALLIEEILKKSVAPFNLHLTSYPRRGQMNTRDR